MTTSIVHCHCVAELPLKDGGEEGGAERKGQTWQCQPVVGEVQVGFVGAERDEARIPCRRKMLWIAYKCSVSYKKWWYVQ